MEVLGFQIFFFLLILFTALFGRKARNLAIIGSIIFTLIMVFTNWLIILQLFTVIVGYFVSENYVDKSKDNLQNIDKKYGQGCIIFLVLGGIALIFMKIYADNYNKKNESQEIEYAQREHQDSLQTLADSTNIYYGDSLATTNYQDNNYEDYPTIIDSSLQVQNEPIYNQVKSKKQIIQNFIYSENNRDFYSMNSYLSNEMYKFWFFEFPSNQKIAKSYYSTWSKYDYTNTEILEILEVENDHYLIKTRYSYNDNTKLTEINFIFDDNEKIVAIY